MTDSLTTQSIVAGVDGSKAAIRAALWAVDEAESRGVPLRLLYATDPGDGEEAAELALRHAVAAIRATGKPVRVETEIAHGPAVGSLIRSSASAAMVCVGAVGLRHFQRGRVGSTAAALAISAHCPVAIVRGGDGRRDQPEGKTVVEIDGSPDSVLLTAAVEEALLRDAPSRRSSRGAAGPPNAVTPRRPASRSPTSIAGWPDGSAAIRSCESNRWRYTPGCWTTWPPTAVRSGWSSSAPTIAGMWPSWSARSAVR